MLCIHGAMGGYDQSLTLGRAIGPPGYRYIGVSRPGYLGTSIKMGKKPEAQADLHAALLDKLNIVDVIVMAISGGGPSALHFSHRHSKRCRKLILCSTVAGPTKQEIPLSFYLMTMLARVKPLMKYLQKKTKQNIERSLSRLIKNQELLQKTLENEEVMQLFKVILIGSFDNIDKRIQGTKNDIRISNTCSYPLQDIDLPALIIHGTHDPLLPFEQNGKRLASEISNAHLYALQDGGHSAIFSHNKQVRKAVAEFVQCEC